MREVCAFCLLTFGWDCGIMKIRLAATNSEPPNKKKESACFTLSVCQIVPVGCGQGRRLTRRACARLVAIYSIRGVSHSYELLSPIRLGVSLSVFIIAHLKRIVKGFYEKTLIFGGHRSGENLSGDIGNQPSCAVLRERPLPYQTAGEENAVFALPPTDSHIREEDFPLGGGKVLKDLAGAPDGTGVLSFVQQCAETGENSNFHRDSSFLSGFMSSFSIYIIAHPERKVNSFF